MNLKVLVLSDSHAGLSFMRAAVRAVKPDALIHLGDYFEDGETMAAENSHIPIYQVPGNCDKFRCFGKPELMCVPVFGAMLYMVHGHNQGVKYTLGKMLTEARAMGAQAALYGHTHVADVHREEDGLWVINPGSCGSYSGSVALLHISEGRVQDCRILSAADLTESAAPL